MNHAEILKRLHALALWPCDTDEQKDKCISELDELRPMGADGKRHFRTEELPFMMEMVNKLADYQYLKQRLNRSNYKIEKENRPKKISATEAIMTAVESGPKSFADILLANQHLSPNTIRQTISGLSMGGVIERIDRGIYALPGTAPLHRTLKRPAKFKTVEEMLDYFFEENTEARGVEFIRKWGTENGNFNKGLDIVLFELNRRARIGDIIRDTDEGAVTYWYKEQ